MPDKLINTISFTPSAFPKNALDTVTLRRLPPCSNTKNMIFAVVLVLGVVERLSVTANKLSLERDWMPILVQQPTTQFAKPLKATLSQLNAVMKRIDLACKVVTPSLASLIVSSPKYRRIGIIIIAALGAVSWAIEFWCARKVYLASPALRYPKVQARNDGSNNTREACPTRSHQQLYRLSSGFPLWFLAHINFIKQYFSTDVWIPSMAWAVLHLSVLAYSASLITWMLNAGFSLPFITIAKATGSIVEFASTLITPRVIRRFSREKPKQPGLQADGATETDELLAKDNQANDKRREEILERLGLFGVSWQFLNLVPFPCIVLPKPKIPFHYLPLP